MAFFLNIETSTEICSICISEDETILALKDADDPYVHAGSITLLIQDCLKQAGITLEQISAVSVSSGPGSYTALRIGTSTAKGICYALDKPLISIDTLQALATASAQNMSGEWLHCPMIDARRMEVYTAVYDTKGNTIADKQALIVEADSFDAYFSNGKKIIFSGNGSKKCQAILDSPFAVFGSIVCSATHLVPLTYKAFLKEDFCDLAYYEPFYLKAPNITTPKKIL